jgi:hypothetical protein
MTHKQHQFLIWAVVCLVFAFVLGFLMQPALNGLLISAVRHP